jgi:hypothetical protein
VKVMFRPHANCIGGWVFPRDGPDLLDKENLLLSGHEARMFHVVTLDTIPENGSAVFIEVCTSL